MILRTYPYCFITFTILYLKVSPLILFNRYKFIDQVYELIIRIACRLNEPQSSNYELGS